MKKIEIDINFGKQFSFLWYFLVAIDLWGPKRVAIVVAVVLVVGEINKNDTWWEAATQ